MRIDLWDIDILLELIALWVREPRKISTLKVDSTTFVNPAQI
jgi:hypothetical protein